MTRLLTILLLFPLPAIPETADIAWSQFDMAISGQMCSTKTDIEEYGQGDPAMCLIESHRLDDIQWAGHWRNRPETVFDKLGDK